MTLPLVRVTRYVTPLREGGSLPGIVEGEDLGTYVCKFRGAGQGLRVLVAEVLVAGIARRIGIPTPEQVILDLDPDLARFEADEEVQDLLNASAGTNLGVDFLPGAFGFESTHDADPDLAARILWMDAFVANVDRSWRNPNMLIWRDTVYAIDHGASLYFHHSWPAAGYGIRADPARFAGQAFDVGEHIFSDYADQARSLDAELVEELTDGVLAQIAAEVPADWLEPVPGAEDPEAVRARYVDFLQTRLSGSRPWLPDRPVS